MADADFQPRYTVSSLTQAVSAALETRFTRIFVDGEISGWRVYPSGHAYFTLKDDGAQISAVMFKSSLERCRVRDGLKDGARVLVCGKISVYGPRGTYQLVALAIKLQGEGDLMQRYLELKARLEAEGLFDAQRKRPLPTMPRRIGIVTSEAGAVIHDMCTVLTRRFPNLEITLYPSLVQGAEAPRTLIAGIDYFNRLKPDLVIIARGGGSFEDLFCFNDEALVRAVAGSVAPIISAVGHETDFTLCDFAADKRAGTPSIAAEIAVPVMSELKTRLATYQTQLAAGLRAKGEWYAQRLDHLSDVLAGALTRVYEGVETQLDRLSTKLDLLSPYGVLDRGYALVTTDAGGVVRDAASVPPGTALNIRLAHGSVFARATRRELPPARAYIFDMDGTLVDNCGVHVEAWQAFSRTHGRELTAREILDWMGAKGSFYIEQIVGRVLPPEEVARLCAEKEEIYRRLYKPVMPEGLRAWLDRAHREGIACALATGGPKENVDFILDALDLRRDFRVIVDGSMYTHSKPDPECFLAAAERLGVPPADCCVFEDAVNGIGAARAAGMRVVAITFTNPRDVLEAAGADRVIDSYGELNDQT